MTEVTAAGALLLAFVGDAMFGDPPNRLHLVAWMGRWIAWARRRSTSRNHSVRFLVGGLVVGIGATVVAVAGVWIEIVCRECPWWAAVLIQGVVLKYTFSVRCLGGAAKQVHAALQANDLAQARGLIAYHLVSRDVTELDASQISAATIESVAENTSDSVVAPLFYFLIAGLPGALVYRFVNTCDAMLGYRTEELEWFGKPAARIDDVLNYIPARITAVLMLIPYGMFAGRLHSATAIWLRDRGLTASPNAGQPMSAAAGVLGISLEKQDHYLLGSGQPLPNGDSIRQSVRLLRSTSFAAVILFTVVLVLRGAV